MDNKIDTKIYLTDNGIQRHLDAIAKGEAIEISHVVIDSLLLPADKDPSKVEFIAAAYQPFPAHVKRVHNTLQIFSDIPLGVGGFNIWGVAFMLSDNTVFAYARGYGDYKSENDPLRIKFEVEHVNTDNITISYDANALFVTHHEFFDHKKEHDEAADPHDQYQQKAHAATDAEIDAKTSSTLKHITLSRLWRALAKVTSDANKYALALKDEAVIYTQNRHEVAIAAVNTAKAQSATDATNKANKALVDAKAYTVTKHGEAINHTNVEKGKTIASIKAWADQLFFKNSGGDLSGNIRIVRGDNQNSKVELLESNGQHGAAFEYDADLNQGQLASRNAGVRTLLMKWARGSKIAHFMGEIYAKDNKRVYHDDYHPQADNADTLNNKNSAQIVDLAAQYTNAKHSEQQKYIVDEIANIMGGMTPDNLNSIVELIGKIEGNETAIDLIERIQLEKLSNNAAAQTIDGGQSTTLTIKSNDNGMSRLALYGEVQGTGDVYVGQSFATGGGFTYNGDGTPFVMDQVFSDHVVHYRKSNHVYSWVFRYSHNNSKVTYRNTPYVGEHAIFHKGNDGHGSDLDADTLDGSHGEDFTKKTELNALVRAATVGGNYCYKSIYHWNNYQSVVVLLQKKSVSTGVKRDSLSGKITLRRGSEQSGNSLISIGIDIQSAYNENRVQYIEYMDTRGIALAECMYNGEAWYCLCQYGNIQDNHITFIGTREGGSTHETDFLKVIPFRGDNTQPNQELVTNEEVNNSVKSVKASRGVNFISAPTVNNIPVFCKDHPPAWEDVGGDEYFTRDTILKYIKTSGNYWNMASSAATGWMPSRGGVGSKAVSFLGNSGWWFKEAWANHYRGGSVDVTSSVVYNAKRLVGDIDFNDYVRTESFNVYETSTMRNAPASGKYGTLHVIGSQSDYGLFVSQTFIERASGEVWTRGKNDGEGKWSEWAKQYNTRNPPTAADVKAIPTSDRQNIINEAIKEGVPAGVPLPWASDTPPSGYAIMKGQAIAPEHTKLRALYGTNLKDMRGMAIVGTPSGVSVLSYQSDYVKSHGHTGSISSKDLGNKYSSYAGEHSHPYSRSNYANDNIGKLSLGSDGKYTTYNSASAGNHRHYTAMGSHNHGVTINKYGSAQNTIRNVKFNWIVRLA